VAIGQLESVTPGVSAADAEVTSATVSAQTTANVRNIELSSPHSIEAAAGEARLLAVGSWPKAAMAVPNIQFFF